MNMDYSQFYRGTTNIPSYGKGPYKKDTLVKYEFHTKDEQGNKVMDQMSKEETLQAMKEIRSWYGDAVIVEFSGDGMAALVESKKGGTIPEDQEAIDAKNAAFQKEIPGCMRRIRRLRQRWRTAAKRRKGLCMTLSVRIS